jgi:hypothetical protein
MSSRDFKRRSAWPAALGACPFQIKSLPLAFVVIANPEIDATHGTLPGSRVLRRLRREGESLPQRCRGGTGQCRNLNKIHFHQCSGLFC